MPKNAQPDTAQPDSAQPENQPVATGAAVAAGTALLLTHLAALPERAKHEPLTSANCREALTSTVRGALGNSLVSRMLDESGLRPALKMPPKPFMLLFGDGRVPVPAEFDPFTGPKENGSVVTVILGEERAGSSGPDRAFAGLAGLADTCLVLTSRDHIPGLPDPIRADGLPAGALDPFVADAQGGAPTDDLVRQVAEITREITGWNGQDRALEAAVRAVISMENPSIWAVTEALLRAAVGAEIRRASTGLDWYNAHDLAGKLTHSLAFEPGSRLFNGAPSSTRSSIDDGQVPGIPADLPPGVTVLSTSLPEDGVFLTGTDIHGAVTRSLARHAERLIRRAQARQERVMLAVDTTDNPALEEWVRLFLARSAPGKPAAVVLRSAGSAFFRDLSRTHLVFGDDGSYSGPPGQFSVNLAGQDRALPCSLPEPCLTPPTLTKPAAGSSGAPGSAQNVLTVWGHELAAAGYLLPARALRFAAAALASSEPVRARTLSRAADIAVRPALGPLDDLADFASLLPDGPAGRLGDRIRKTAQIWPGPVADAILSVFTSDFRDCSTDMLRALPGELGAEAVSWLDVLVTAESNDTAVPRSVTDWFRHRWAAGQTLGLAGPSAPARPGDAPIVPTVPAGLTNRDGNHLHAPAVDCGWVIEGVARIVGRDDSAPLKRNHVGFVVVETDDEIDGETGGRGASVQIRSGMTPGQQSDWIAVLDGRRVRATIEAVD